MQMRILPPPLHTLPATRPSELMTQHQPSSFFSVDDFRPQASEIVPRVFISDLYTAQSRSTLLALGVTHVVSVMRGFIELPQDLRLQTLQVAIEDMPFADLLPHLDVSTAFIHSALASSPNARVLIHCAKGVSRSSSIAAAYLVAVRGCSVPQAIDHIKSRRRIALPNVGFVMQLEEYAANIRAQGR